MSRAGAGVFSRLKGALGPRPRRGHDPEASLGLIELGDIKSSERSALEARVRSRASYVPIEQGVGLARTLGRHKLYVIPEDDAVSSHLILDGFWEMWNTQFLAGFVRPGMSVIGVGANLGYFSLLLSDLVGPTGRVVCFEPLSRVAKLLKRSISINGFNDRSTVVNVAVSDRNAVARMTVPSGNWGGGSFMRGEAVDDVASEQVQTTSLDAYCETNNLQPDFIKMDVEGAERMVWSGMADLVRRSDKLAVMFEFDPRRMREWRDWFGELGAMGFVLKRVGEDSKLHAFVADSPEPNGIIEIVALKGYR